MRIFSKVLLSSLVAFAFAGNAFGAGLSLNQDKEGNYLITSCNDLKEFSDWMNEVTVTIAEADTACSDNPKPKITSATFTHSSVNAKLTQDINCSGVNGLQPIGASTYTIKYSEKGVLNRCSSKTHDTTLVNKFTGNFDGAGHKISNLNISTENYVGLFGYVDGGTISDVYIENSTFTVTGKKAGSRSVDTTLYYYSGAIAAYMGSGTIHGCVTTNTTVTGPSQNYQAWASGGIVGRNKGGTIEKCTVTGGSVIGRTEVGGIVGINEENGTVTDCLASPDVLSRAIQIATGFGGVIGKNEGHLSRVVYTGSSVKSNNSGSNAIGGPIVGAGIGCDSKCFYTENVGLVADGNDALEDDINEIKKQLGDPWDVYSKTLVIDYVAIYYKVYIDPNGHGTLDSTLVKIEDGLIPPMDSIMAAGDYKRVGLCKNAACSESDRWDWATDKITTNGSLLYANWAQAYLVTFTIGTAVQTSGGHFPKKAVTTKYCVNGEKITANGITEPVFDDAAFIGWSKENDASTDADLGNMDNAPKTIYAIGTKDFWTITYNKGTASGATGAEVKVRVAKNYTLTLEGALFTRDGYAQDKWTSNTSGGYGGTTYEFNTSQKFTKNMTLYPHWTNSNLNTIDYKFDANHPADGNGKTIASSKKAPDVKVKLSEETFYREGYTQDGWSRIEGGDKSYSLGDEYSQNSNATLYPHWRINKHAVKYRYTLDNGTTYTVAGDVDSVEYASANVAVRAKYIADGFEMSGWTTSDVTVNSGTFTMPDNDVVFTATGTRKSYTITYYVDGAQDGNASTLLFDAEVTAREISKTGYTFSGWTWYSLAGGEPQQLTEAPSTMPAYNLKAVGTLAPNSYEATFNANGGAFGENAVTTKNVNYDADITSASISTPSRAGYDFLGWARTADATAIPENLGKMDNTEGVTLYAVWQVKTYTITFDSKGGSEVTDITADYETKIDAPDDPTKDGYTFEGWFTDEAFEDPFTFSTMPLDGATLVAKWSLTNYTITYNLVEGANNEANPTSYTIETETITLQEPIKTGYKFIGWYTEESFENQVTEIAKGSTEGKVFFAKWLPIVNITMESSSSSPYNGQKQSIGVTVTGLPEGNSLVCDSITDVTSSQTITCGVILDAEGTDVTSEYVLVYTDDVDEGLLTITMAMTNDVAVTLSNWTFGSTETPDPVVTGGFGAETATFLYASTSDTTSQNSWKSDKPTAIGDYYVKATIPGTINYVAGSAVGTFAILSKTVENLVVTVTPTSNAYNGAAQTPSIVLKDGDDELKAVDDYIVTITKGGEPTSEMKNVGEYTITITGEGTYGGSVQKTYTITQATTAIEVALEDWAYDAEMVPTPVVTPDYVPAGEAEIKYAKAGTDTTNPDNWTTEKPTDAGDYFVKVTVEDTDNYRGGSATGEFKIEKSDPTVVVSLDGWTYAGEANNPSVTPEYIDADNVTYQYAKAGTDTTNPDNWTTEPPTDAGEYFVKAVVAEGDNYNGTESEAKLFEIEKATEAITVALEDWTYDAETVPTPVVTPDYVPAGEAEIKYAKAGTDTTNPDNWTTEKPTDAGEYFVKVTVEDTDNYQGGSATGEFTIDPKPVTEEFTVVVENGTYDGTPKAPTVVVKDGETVLESPKDFSIVYPDDMTSVGKHEITINGNGNYDGSTIVTYIISPEVKTVLPENVALVCDAGAQGAEFCNATKDAIVYVFDTATDPLPNAVMKDATTGDVDNTWAFEGWFDNENLVAGKIDETKTGKKVEAIPADQTEALNLYPKFTKELEITLSRDPEVKVEITIDNNDNADSVSKKVNEAYENITPAPADPTKAPNDSLEYTFKEYECTGTGVDFTCEAKFDSTGRVFEVVENLPEGATLVCTDGAKGAANCNEDGSGIVHQYGKETTPLPDVVIVDGEGEVDETWKFHGWFDNPDGIDDGTNGNEVTSISKDEYGDNINIYPYFTKQIEITLSGAPEVKVEITIDNNDNADSVSQKVNEAYKNLTPAPKNPTKDSSDKYIYTFKEYKCSGTGIDYTCEAKFDSTGRVFEVVENLPEGATLVCTDGAKGAVNCNEDGSGIVHQYGKETTPLPDVVIVDGEGEVDETWKFHGWFDNPDGFSDGTNGNEVTSISKDEYGDNINIYPYFTKQIEITLSRDPEVKVEITIDNNDNADSVSKKVNEAYENITPAPADPTKAPNDSLEYTFKEYKCSGTGIDYTCEAKFDSTGRVFEVVENLPEGATLVCTDGAKGAANCNEDGSGIVHQYGKETTPLPDVVIVDGEGEVDETWKFHGWFDNPDGFSDGTNGNEVISISKDEYGDNINIYPYFTKQIEITLSGDPEVKVEITIDNNDNADSVSKKVNEAYENITPAPADPTKAPNDSLVYTFKEYKCTGSGVDFTCEAKFDSTGRVFEVVENLPEGAALVCTEGAQGAENCNEDGSGIVHQYGKETTPLPDVVIVDGEGEVDETWKFHGWFDNPDGIDDGTNGKEVTSISKDEYGDNINIYPYFTKQIEITLSGDPEVKVEITIDNNDNADSVSKKVNEAYENITPAPADPTKDTSDKYIYTFKEYECTGSGIEYTCEAKFDSTGRVFEVVENLPEGATLVCTEGAQGAENCNSDKTGIKHQYGVETAPLPNAAMEGWTFEGWYGDSTIFAEPAVTSIPADEYGEEINIFPKFTKQIEITLSEDPEVKVEITIDNNDNADSVSKKVNEAYENITPAPADPTRPMDDSLVYTFKEYECTGSGIEYTCEAKFDSTGRVFEVAENLSDNMKLVCEGEAAAACNEFETGIEHKYGVETNPLPEVVIVDSEGKVDEFWEFQGWFDNPDGFSDGTNGNKVEKIDAEVFGDVVIYPYFTKVIEVVIGDQTIKIVIDDNDTQDSINAKVSEAAKNHDPVIEPDPKHIEKEPFIYDFAGYKCELLESNRYECVPDFDESGKKYEVAVNLPKDAKLLCEGEAAAACNEAGDAIVHQYGTETSPLPSAVIIGMDGSVDESWHFRGWFDNENGIADGSMEGGAGKKIFEIAAERYGDIDIYPYFTKTIQVKIGNEVVDVVIDNNDTQDSISVKATEAAANREPPIPTPTKDKDDKYEYEFAGYVCDQKFVCEPTFDAVPYDVEVVLAYGDDAEDTIMVKVLSTDDVPTIEKKVYVEFMSHDPMLPIPEKASDPMYTYEFNKFAVNLETGRYEPKFTSSPRIYKITFNMPEDAKLTKEISGNTYGEETILPQAVINGSDWQFKGWYTEKDGNGSRVKVIGAQDVGAREYFALFQKTVVYEVNGKQGNLEVAYSANASKAVDLALSGVIVKDFEENGRTFTFSKWELKKGVYVAKFTDITAIAQTNVPHFSVIAVDRTLEITGAKMGAKIAVFDLGGRLVTTGIVANGTQLVELANPGSYIVRVNNQVRRVNVR